MKTGLSFQKKQLFEKKSKKISGTEFLQDAPKMSKKSLSSRFSWKKVKKKQ
jgi:hypothetical protein